MFASYVNGDQSKTKQFAPPVDSILERLCFPGKQTKRQKNVCPCKNQGKKHGVPINLLNGTSVTRMVVQGPVEPTVCFSDL